MYSVMAFSIKYQAISRKFKENITCNYYRLCIKLYVTKFYDENNDISERNLKITKMIHNQLVESLDSSTSTAITTFFSSLL